MEDGRPRTEDGGEGAEISEIRNTKHEIRNNIKTRMFKWAKRKGIADSADSHRLGQPQNDEGIGSKCPI